MGTYAKKWNKSKYKIKNLELKLIVFGWTQIRSQHQPDEQIDLEKLKRWQTQPNGKEAAAVTARSNTNLTAMTNATSLFP